MKERDREVDVIAGREGERERENTGWIEFLTGQIGRVITGCVVLWRFRSFGKVR